MRTFKGGGSLDGLTLELPAHVPGVVSTRRLDNESHYVVDDITGTAWFAGFNELGSEMGKIMRAFSAEARAEAERERAAIAAAAAAQGCSKCGRLFANQASYVIHRDGDRCLPDGCYGQLILVDGAAWDEAWRHPELAR